MPCIYILDILRYSFRERIEFVIFNIFYIRISYHISIEYFQKAAKQKMLQKNDTRNKSRKTRYQPYQPQWSPSTRGFKSYGSYRNPNPWTQPLPVPGQVQPRQPGPSDGCYHCGMRGHFRNRCPQLASNSATPKCSYDFHEPCKENVKNEKSNQSDWVYMTKNYVPPEMTNDINVYENSVGQIDISVVGRLKENVQFWQNITSSQMVIDTIKNGYSIPMIEQPSPICLANNKSSRDAPEFVRTEINKLIASEAVVETMVRPYCVNPLTVAQRKGKQRLVLDLRHVNECVYKQKIKFDDHDVMVQYFRPEGYMFKFDLKNGYHHLEILEAQQQLLGFAYPDERGIMRYFRFKVLPFGLTSAGYIFTKILRALIQHWRSKSFHIALFLDDGLDAEPNLNRAVEVSGMVHGDLNASGFVPNVQKSNWQPVQCIEWLGSTYDLKDMVVTINEEKIEKVIVFLKDCMKLDVIHIKVLAALTSTITSLYLSHGDLVFLKSKSLAVGVASAASWSEKVKVSEDMKLDMLFWVHNLRHFNGQSLRLLPGASQLAYSDASGIGLAALITPGPEQHQMIFQKQFTEEEKLQGSTYRELLAILEGIINFKSILANTVVDWFTDSQSGVHIIKRGSMKPHLQKLALRIFEVSRRNGIKIRPVWIPREHNTVCDYYSKVLDPDDWEVRPEWYEIITNYWGKPSIDRFACYYNTKLPRFNSKFFDESAEAIDAFSQFWGDDFNWLVPPIYLVPRVIDYLHMCKGSGILIVPLWKSATFWPFVADLLSGKQFGLQDQWQLGNIFKQTKNKNSLFGSENWKSSSLAILLNFRN